MRPQQLAEAGFFYTGYSDRTACFQCDLGLSKWRETDDPWREHALSMPKCSFLLQWRGHDFIKEVLRQKPPVHSVSFNRPLASALYETLESRLESFDSWPVRFKISAHELAEAGFFYPGYGDRTFCFKCGGGLCMWEETDDPWREHAYWLSECSFVLQSKGQDFIDEVLRIGKKGSTLTPEVDISTSVRFPLSPSRKAPALTKPKEFSNVVQLRTSQSTG